MPHMEPRVGLELRTQSRPELRSGVGHLNQQSPPGAPQIHFEMKIIHTSMSQTRWQPQVHLIF